MNESGKVTDIYFLSQLTPDEKVDMVSSSFMLLPVSRTWQSLDVLSPNL